MPIHQYRDGRVKLTGHEYTQMKVVLCNLADSTCEVCGKYVGPKFGDPDHVVLRGMGGAKRDDRIFVDGKRQLLWKCRTCHSGRHIPAKVIPVGKLPPEEFKKLLGIKSNEGG